MHNFQYMAGRENWRLRQSPFQKKVANYGRKIQNWHGLRYFPVPNYRQGEAMGTNFAGGSKLGPE